MLAPIFVVNTKIIFDYNFVALSILHISYKRHHVHVQHFSSFINLIIFKKWIQVAICQTDLILTLNCVNVSKWVPSLTWQVYHKLSKICSSTYSLNQVKKEAQIWCFASTSFSYNIFTNGLSKIFHRWFKDFWTYVFIMIYLNITRTFHLINSKNMPGEFYSILAFEHCLC